MKDLIIESTTVQFTPKWIPDVYDWIKNMEELLYWSGNTFLKNGFSIKSFKDHLTQKKIMPYARVDGQQNILAYGEIVRHQNSQHANLCRIIVRPTLRKKGIGTAFCKSLIDESAKTKAFQSIGLNVLECNLPAVACYHSLGFKIIRRILGARKIEGKAYDLVVMSKNIEPTK